LPASAEITKPSGRTTSTSAASDGGSSSRVSIASAWIAAITARAAALLASRTNTACGIACARSCATRRSATSGTTAAASITQSSSPSHAVTGGFAGANSAASSTPCASTTRGGGAMRSLSSSAMTTSSSAACASLPSPSCAIQAPPLRTITHGSGLALTTSIRWPAGTTSWVIARTYRVPTVATCDPS